MSRWLFLRRWTLAWLLISAFPGFKARATEADPFAGWPQTWVDTYRRFENFMAAEMKYFPPANLEIFPDGRVVHSVQLFPGRTESLSIAFFREGANFLTIDMDEQLFNQSRARLFRPGTYSAAVRSCGLAGYQYLYPVIWFEVAPAGTPDSGDLENGVERRVRMIRAPQPAEDFWPNERLFRFLDFDIFPDHNPHDIRKQNNKVKPSVTLDVADSSFIVRESLDASLEALLHWRIYHHGQLIEKGPAGGATRFSCDHGPGFYQAFVGVEGPAGFMPVSNLLKFSLPPPK